MGLSFLNKKTWHPGSFANIEKVWIAEQKQRELERKQIENIKKLKEERQIEELKKMQVEAGLIPAAHLQRLDWIYQAPECTSNITTAEEFLLGKPLKEEKQEEKRHFTPVFQESYSNPNNEIFTKIHEDPLFVMKKEEMKARKEIEENPYRMKMMLKEIEASIMNQKLERKEKKKKDKKKDKKHREHKKDKHHSTSRDSDIEITTPSLLKLHDNFGLVDKEGKKIKVDSNNRNLGPDMNLYKERKEEKEREMNFRKRNHSHSSSKYLSEDEREKLRRDMENKAKLLDFEKMKKINGDNDKEHKSHSRHSSSSRSHKPDFLKNIDRSVYTGNDISLEDRIKMNKNKLMKD